jgi:hypothetical protein
VNILWGKRDNSAHKKYDIYVTVCHPISYKDPVIDVKNVLYGGIPELISFGRLVLVWTIYFILEKGKQLAKYIYIHVCISNESY